VFRGFEATRRRSDFGEIGLILAVPGVKPAICLA
jgi:hypothetical protein